MKLRGGHWLERARQKMLPGDLEKPEQRDIWIVLTAGAAIVLVYCLLRDYVDVQFVLEYVSRKF